MKGESMAVRDSSPRYAPGVCIPVVPEGYKKTDVGSIPEVWECVPIASLGDGKVPPVKAGPFGSSITKDQYVPAGYKVYGQEQVIRGDYLYGDYFISARKYRELESCAVRPGDILLSLVGTLGKLLEIPDEAPQGVINPRLLRLSLDRQRILPRFLKYLFESEGVQARLERQAQGGTMGVLNAGVLRRFSIALPPLNEQRAIATALSDVDALLEALDRLIAKKRDIKQATMQQLLTAQTRLPGFEGEWEVKQLGALGSFHKGSGVRRDEAQSGSLPCVRYGEIYTVHDDVIREFQSWISRDVAAAAVRIQRGDLLFAGSGETKDEIGKCVAVVTDEEAYAGGDIVILRAFNANPVFMGYALNQPAVNMQKSSFGQGDAVVHISATALSQIVIKLPPEAEQNAIAAVLSDIDAELELLRQRHVKTAALKQAMMQELLTGRTRLGERTREGALHG